MAGVARLGHVEAFWVISEEGAVSGLEAMLKAPETARAGEGSLRAAAAEVFRSVLSSGSPEAPRIVSPAITSLLSIISDEAAESRAVTASAICISKLVNDEGKWGKP